MRKAAKKAPAKKAAQTQSKPQSKWKKDSNDTQTHTGADGRYFIAHRLEDDSYSVTVCASNAGDVLYSTRVDDDESLDNLIS